MKAEQSNSTDQLCEGQQIYALGRFWPVAIADLDRFGGTVFIPDKLWLIEEDRIMVALGDLPTLPATVVRLEQDLVELRFCQPLHQSVLDLTGHRSDGSATDDLRIAA